MVYVKEKLGAVKNGIHLMTEQWASHVVVRKGFSGV